MRISDWSSDVCSSDLVEALLGGCELKRCELLRCELLRGEAPGRGRPLQAAVRVRVGVVRPGAAAGSGATGGETTARGGAGVELRRWHLAELVEELRQIGRAHV